MGVWAVGVGGRSSYRTINPKTPTMHGVSCQEVTGPKNTFTWIAVMHTHTHVLCVE